jgi:SAM-dependent methyltransferase
LHERALREEWRRETGRTELDRRFAHEHGLTVQAGPFAGMRYPHRGLERVDHLTSKLLGAYEQELAAVVAVEASRRPPVVVDVGCADGYYAIGLARAIPGARVHAFDVDPVARTMTCRMARANGVAWRVDVRRAANERNLARLDLDDAFVLVDCEGAELDILDGEAVTALASATVLVELHPHGDGDTGGPLRRRFGTTHDIELIVQGGRDLDGYPPLADLPVEERALLLDEARPALGRWAVFTPRGG